MKKNPLYSILEQSTNMKKIQSEDIIKDQWRRKATNLKHVLIKAMLTYIHVYARGRFMR